MIPWYVLNMLRALQEHSVNTIVVSNRRLNDEQLATLRGLSAKVLVRGNKGLDFGAYRDAVLLLQREKTRVSRCLFINDSVYVFAKGLNEALGRLLSNDHPVVSAYENWELHYHFQSFCIGMDGSIFHDPEIRAIGAITAQSRFDHGASIRARSNFHGLSARSPRASR